MKLRNALPLLMVTALVAGCGSNAVAPRYNRKSRHHAD
jgi:hypothetical protein